MQRILIVGANSAIALAAARLFAQRGDTLHLLARSEERLQALAADLRLRGASAVSYAAFDANALDQHGALLDQAVQAMGGIDAALIAHGTLSDQRACQADFMLALKEVHTNALSAMSLLTILANRMEQQRHGTLAVIGSVAGDRGRQSNYVYGAAKGMLDIFLQGLRNRLYKAGVRVVTIKPGFVDTPMTAAIAKGALWATPAIVAARIVKAMDRGWPVVYAPPFWRLVMMVIRAIPESLFRKLSL